MTKDRTLGYATLLLSLACTGGRFTQRNSATGRRASTPLKVAQGPKQGNSNSTKLRLCTTRRPVVDQRRLVHAGVAEEERAAGGLGVEGPQI